MKSRSSKEFNLKILAALLGGATKESAKAIRRIFSRKPQARLDAAQTWSPNRSYRHAPTQDARFDVRQADRNIVAGKARDFEANNAVAQKLGSVFVDYTVGCNGLPVMPASGDSKWNETAKINFNLFAQFPDLCSRQNFGILQGQIAWRWFFDGEIFILKTRGQSADGRWFPRVQLIESHLVGTPPTLAKEEGKTVIDGVAIDKNGRPTGYWVKESSDSNTYRLVDAKNIIHVFEPARPGEYRGLSFLHAVMNDLHDMDDLQKLEMQAAKRNASDERIIETATGEANDEDLVRSGGQVSDADGKKRQNDYEQIFGASTKYLFTGDKLHQNAGERPSVTSREYWDYLTAKICIGVGISKQLVFPYSIQGTIGRFDIDSTSVYFRSRSAVIQAAVREIYIYVIGWGIRTEAALNDPLPPDWTNVSIRPPRAPNADVGRNSAAMIAELATGATTMDAIYGAQGLDWKQELKQRAQEAAYIQALAIEFNVTAGEISQNAADALVKHADALEAESAKQSEDDKIAA